MDWPIIIGSIVGGGGITGLLIKLAALKQEHDKGELQREDTAITRWQSIASRAEKEADQAWRIVSWYRRHYPLLYTAYERLPPEEKEKFPIAPPPEVDEPSWFRGEG